MRVMILAKTTPEVENMAPRSPSAGEMDAINEFQDELVSAGIMLATGRLEPSSKGALVRFDGAKRSVIDGPFTEAKEIVGGFWLWQVRSVDEAIEWLKRAPFGGGQFEVRPVVDDEPSAS